MAVSHARDPNWAAPLFCDAQKLASLVEELKERIEQQLENEKVSGSTHTAAEFFELGLDCRVDDWGTMVHRGKWRVHRIDSNLIGPS